MSGGGDFVQRGENDIVKIEINVLNLKYVPTIGLPILLEEICRTILGLYK
jgi:hypothetical protein